MKKMISRRNFLKAAAVAGSAIALSACGGSGDDQDALRWLYYRKRTEGQNTILVNKANQLVGSAATTHFDNSGTQQGSSTVFEVPGASTAYYTADLTSAYASV